MSRIARLVVLVTGLVSLCTVLTPAAGAVTWHNTGSTAFTATGGPMSLSIGSNSLACSSMSVTGTAPGGSVVATAYAASGTLVQSPCSLVGQSLFWHCTYTLTVLTSAPPVASGAMGMTCDFRLTAAPANNLCHISGSVPITYTNPSGSTKGKITLSAATSLTVTNGAVACPLGTGTASSTEVSINVTNGTPTTLGPILTRTA